MTKCPKCGKVTDYAIRKARKNLSSSAKLIPRAYSERIHSVEVAFHTKSGEVIVELWGYAPDGHTESSEWTSVYVLGAPAVEVGDYGYQEGYYVHKPLSSYTEGEVRSEVIQQLRDVMSTPDLARKSYLEGITPALLTEIALSPMSVRAACYSFPDRPDDAMHVNLIPKEMDGYEVAQTGCARRIRYNPKSLSEEKAIKIALNWSEDKR